MSQAGYTPIQLYYSTTAAAVPVNTNLASGELAINITDGKLYYKDNGGTVRLLASNATSAPVLTFSAGTTGFTPSSATSGVVTLAGTLATTNGGTGLTSFTSGGVVYASSGSALATGSALTFDGSRLDVQAAIASTAVTSTTGTNSASSRWVNTGGTLYVGIEQSATGALLTGDASYAGVIARTGAYPLQFGTNDVVRATIDSAGTLGLGVVPNAGWSSTFAKAIQLGDKGASISAYTSSLSANPFVNISNNAYFASDGNWKYYDGGYAVALYQQLTNSHNWYIAGTGTTGNTISFSQAMILDSYGNLGLGTTSFYPSAPHVYAPQIRVGLTGNYFSQSNAGLGEPGTSFLDNAFVKSSTGNFAYITSAKASRILVRAGEFYFQRSTGTDTADAAVNFTTTAVMDSAGNLGLGVTPSAAWASSAYLAAQFGLGGVIMASQVSAGVSIFNSGANFKYDGSDYRRINAEEASQYQQASGSHNWRIAASSTANSVITWTQAMTLTAAGRLGIGVTNPTFKAEVWGDSATFSDATRNFGLFDTQTAGSGAGGGIAFGGYYNGTTDYVNDFAGIQGMKENGTAGNYAGCLRFTTRINGGNPTERMRIDSAGNVGIGTSSPNKLLSLSTSDTSNSVIGAAGLQIVNTSASAAGRMTSITFGGRATTNYPFAAIAGILTDDSAQEQAGDLAFYTKPTVTAVNPTERMRIYANGGLSFANTASPGAFNTVLGDRNNHFTGQRSNTVAGGATSTMLTITFSINGAAIVRVVDTGTVLTSNYFMNVYEYFVTCYNTVVTVTLKQSQIGGGSGSMITTSTSGSIFSVIQTADASLTTVHDTAVDVLVVSAGNGSHDTTSISMAASN